MKAESRATRAVRAAFLVGVLASGVSLLVPLEILAGNRDEFGSPTASLLRPFLLIPAMAALLAAVLGALLTAAAWQRAMVLIAALGFLAWCQAYLLVWSYGLFDGRAIDWERGAWRGWVDASVWIAVLLMADAWRERVGRLLERGVIALWLAQAAWQLTTWPWGTNDSTRGVSPAGLVDLAAFGPSGNVLHIVADGFQSDIFLALAAEPDPVDQFDGFTVFTDHLGVFTYTHMSVPALLSGQIYDNQEPQQTFMARALGEQSILSAAAANGYSVLTGVPAGALTTLYRYADDVHVIEIPSALYDHAWRAVSDEGLLLADMALFRIVPHSLKRLVNNDQSWLLQLVFGHNAAPGRSFFAHTAFLRQYAQSLRVEPGPPAYRLLHLMLSHSPMVATRDCEFAGKVLPQRRGPVMDQTRCSLRAIAVVMQALRSAGIYDSTTIIISGDHGSWVEPEALRAEPLERMAFQVLGIAPAYIGHAMPLLLIKPPGATGPLRKVSTPSWIVDTPATIADAAAIPGRFPGSSALRLEAGPRKRTFHDYGYSQRDWSTPHLPDIQQYVVDGPVLEPHSWTLGKVLRPPAKPPAR